MILSYAISRTVVYSTKRHLAENRDEHLGIIDIQYNQGFLEKGVGEMPAIVGAVNVNSVSGVFNIGDVRTISPSTISKTFAGGGSFNSGDRLQVNNAPSIIKVVDTDNDGPVYAQEVIESCGKERTER